MAAAICLLIGSFGVANAQSLDQQDLIIEWRARINLIADAADRICTPPPLVESNNATRLSVSASAGLNGILKILTDFGLKTSWDRLSEERRGMLQKDLGNAIKDNLNCRIAVFFTLQNELILMPPRSAPEQEKRVYRNALDQSEHFQSTLDEAMRRSALGNFDTGSLHWFEDAYGLAPPPLVGRVDKVEIKAARKAVRQNQFPEASAHYVRAFQAIAVPDDDGEPRSQPPGSP